MGTGGSFLRHGDEDDVLGTESGSSQGVIKRIPIEVKPRGKLGLRSVGSVGKKPKGGSLRSALSIDLENPEVERIRKDYEMYRLNKENEVANMQKKEHKLETDNKRLRTELQALQKTCRHMREERDVAMEAKHQAIIRAAAFESDRDKIQRQFKIFRETKETEIQTLLKARRELENRLAKLTYGLEEEDSASRAGLESALGAGNPGDWWTALESEPSLGSTTQLHQGFRGPEFAQSLIELEGPFTNVNKDDWNAAAASLAQIIPTIPESIQTNRISVYVCASRDVQTEVDILCREYDSHLQELVAAEGRFFNIIHMPLDGIDLTSAQTFQNQQEARARRIQMCTIFLAFLGDCGNQFTEIECHLGHFKNPGTHPVIFCLREQQKTHRNSSEMDELRKRVIENGNATIIKNYPLPQQGAKAGYSEIEQILRAELGIERREKEIAEGLYDQDGPEMLCGGCVWDPRYDFEQSEAFTNALKSTCELGFEKLYDQLSAHVAASGPRPPLLITGNSGAGKSLLLAKWIELQTQRASGSMVLHHFVGSRTSCSADPVMMIRRFTAQLMQHVTSPPTLTCDPVRLVEEFPRWLEKVSSKLPGGVILVLDAADGFQQSESQLKWLLDPLPVDSRVVVSIHNKSGPPAWWSWPTLHLEELSNKHVKELLRAELASMGRELDSSQENRILTHCRSPDNCTPLYVVVLASELARCSSSASIDSRLDLLLETPDTVFQYKVLIDLVQQEFENADTRGRLRMMLKLMYASRNGINESELFVLVPGVSWSFWAPLCDALMDRHIVTFQSGLLVFAHEQARQAVEEKFFSDEDGKTLDLMRRTLRDYFAQFQNPSQVTYRVADELPWLNKQMGDKDALQACIINLCVFVKLYGRGRCGELIGFWQYIGMDKSKMAKAYFTALKHMEQRVGEYDGLVTLPRVADIYEAFGRFLRDLGLLVEALTPLQRALEIRETALDPDHPSVAQTLHQVAGLHAQQGKFVTAEALYKQALDIYEGAISPQPYLLSKELDALAILYQKQGKHELADPLHRRAMSIRKKSKGPRSVSGQIRGVDPLSRRVLQLEELAMGPDSPDLARTLNELGVLYYLQNNFEAAESFFLRSLDMRESLLGAEHPDLAQSLNNLAALYNDRKQYAKAEPLYERALQIRQKYYPCDHQSIASIINHLAMLFKKMGKTEKAIPLYKQAVEIRKRSFSANHPSVATALVNLAVLYSQQGAHSSALPLYQKALKIYEDSLGPTHSRVAETLKNMALLKYELGDFQTAAHLYKRATDIKENDPGGYGVKVTSRRSSTADTVSTLKHIGARGQYFANID